jgi:hypothetical protein
LAWRMDACMHGRTKRSRRIVRLAADHIFSISTRTNSLLTFSPHGIRTYVSGRNISDRGGRRAAPTTGGLCTTRTGLMPSTVDEIDVARPSAAGIGPIASCAALLATTGAG